MLSQCTPVKIVLIIEILHKSMDGQLIWYSSSVASPFKVLWSPLSMSRIVNTYMDICLAGKRTVVSTRYPAFHFVFSNAKNKGELLHFINVAAQLDLHKHRYRTEVIPKNKK